MVIWLIQTGEPLPIDGENIRLFRTGMLAELLVSEGHSVVWWCSAFDHFQKRQRFPKDTMVKVNDLLSLKLLHSSGYRRNVSLGRVMNHLRIARKFSKFAKQEQKPDVILCSFPTIDMSCRAVSYGIAEGVPVVIDARDMWPDIFLNYVPPWCRRFIKPVLGSAYAKTKRAFRDATAVTGMTKAFVEWGLGYAGRVKTPLDRDFPFGYRRKIPDRRALEAAETYWRGLGVEKGSGNRYICFFGTFGRKLDFETVIEAAKILEEEASPFRFVLCGSGDRVDYLKRLAEGSQTVIFTGWIGEAEIWSLMRISAAGIAPYYSTEDFRASIPNKIIEYLSAGLPVLSSLEGTVSELLKEHGCGLAYSSVQDFIEKLRSISENETVRRRMSDNALALFRERFTAEKVYGEMIEYLSSICSKFGKNPIRDRQVTMETADFSTVTEITGTKVTAEQIERMYTRYRFASELCRGKEVLEVGFGSGQGLGYIEKSAKRVVGVEYDEKLLETARSYYKDRIELLHMDAQNLTFEDGSFDVVVFYEALYYLQKPEKFLLGAYRVLRDKGTIILCSANKDVSGFNPSPYSYRYFSTPELFDLLDNSGYREIQLYGDCRAATESMRDRVKMCIKRSAVKLNIMPKTMKGKKLLKRIFFGKLVELPPEIDDSAAEYVPPRQVPPDVPNREFKVIFAVASKL